MIEYLSFVLTVEFVACVFILIGLYAVAWWLIDNLKSITQIILSLLLPYFQPQEDLPLSEKYGSWAGKFRCFVLIFRRRVGDGVRVQLLLLVDMSYCA